MLTFVLSHFSSDHQNLEKLGMSPNTPIDKPTDTDTSSSVQKSNIYSKINTNVRSFFDPNFEKAACGVGFIVNIDGIASHKVIINYF